MKIDLTRFTQTLPYASKLLIIYQPLPGWQLKRIIQRIQLGFLSSFEPAMRQIVAKMRPWFELHPRSKPRELGMSRTAIAMRADPKCARVNADVDSFMARAIAERTNAGGLDLADDCNWRKLASTDALDEIFTEVKDGPVLHAQVVVRTNQSTANADALAARAVAMGRESVMAGMLNVFSASPVQPAPARP